MSSTAAKEALSKIGKTGDDFDKTEIRTLRRYLDAIGGRLQVNPLVNTFVSTVVSGGTFALLSVYINVVSTGGDVMVALATYAAIVFGTATFNCILVQVLAMPLKKVLKR